ncbi:hypothetical protein EST38_g6257 [Candolleomyces aberdarensis]|uniref:Cytochrome P450 n=1 Tax=Candolleomyces aberdarensis TaxID=2316362 RepID=A0A4Q2DI86_9AGAR|nr:hypothetical protein EST38_g6257 [Candolleomyces aberdarensis]
MAAPRPTGALAQWLLLRPSSLLGLGLSRKANGLLIADGLACFSFVFILASLVRRYRAKKKYEENLLPLPPCPPKRGPLGHVGIMPKEFEYLMYERWAKELDSDIIHLQLKDKIIIVLHSWEAVTTFLRQESIHELGQESTCDEGRNLLEGETDVISVIRHFTGGLSLSMAYGIEMKAKNDPYVRMSERAMSGLVLSGTPGRWLVDVLPFLKYVPSWFPGAGWKRQAAVWREWQDDMRTKPYDVALANIENGTARPSFLMEAMRSVQDIPSSHDDIELIKDVTATIFAGGSETSATGIGTFFLAMLCHPEVQEKAFAELERVLGPNRLPTFEDKGKLPYITAIMRESLRWQNPNPIALPHKSTEDDVYKGYRIPKGSMVIGNVWALMHNEEEFPEPMAFKPERFLNPDGSLNEHVRDPATAIFGFGRRLCPGRYIALSALWMTIASVLAAFKIEKGLDDDGKPIEPQPNYLPGVGRFPAPFKTTIKVRSQELADIIRSSEGQDL